MSAPTWMQPLKIVVADDLPASALELLRAEGWDVDARTGRAPDQLAIDLQDADAIVVRSATKVTAALIAAAPKLRVIARAGTGVISARTAANTITPASTPVRITPSLPFGSFLLF